MLSTLELYEVIRSCDVPLAEVEEWTNDLRIWYEKAQLDGESAPMVVQKDLWRKSQLTSLQLRRWYQRSQK